MKRRKKRTGKKIIAFLLPMVIVAGIAIFTIPSCFEDEISPESNPISSKPEVSSQQAVSSKAESSKVEQPVSSQAVSSAIVSRVPVSSAAVSSAVQSKIPVSSAVSKVPVSSVVASKVPASSVAPPVTSVPVVPGGSFYNGVKWRSPYAKTADIFKHGRDLMLLNNYYELPEDFQWNLVRWADGTPVDALSLNSSAYDKVQAVDAAAYQPLRDMFAAAKAAGVPLQLVSAYRSIDLQDRLFGSLVTQYMNQGLSREEAAKKANIQRTYAGTSEHNTGYGFDILESGNWYLSTAFDKTAQFRWLQENAAKYGFILRYQANKTAQTGIMYEPWHYRYVGVEHAKAINAMGMCLEEYIAYLDAQ